MKTTLKELLETVDLPLSVDGYEINSGKALIATTHYGQDEKPNHPHALLLAHSANVIGELVEALQAVARLDYLNEHNALADKVKVALHHAETTTCP